MKACILRIKMGVLAVLLMAGYPTKIKAGGYEEQLRRALELSRRQAECERLERERLVREERELAEAIRRSLQVETMPVAREVRRTVPEYNVLDFNFRRDAADIRAIFNESRQILWFLGIGDIPMFLQDPQIPSNTKVLRARTGELIGFVSYSMTAVPTRGYISYLGVARQFRGLGIGRRLLDLALGNLVGQGANTISLWVRPDNVDAIRLYERAGFVKTGEITPHSLVYEWRLPY